MTSFGTGRGAICVLVSCGIRYRAVKQVGTATIESLDMRMATYKINGKDQGTQSHVLTKRRLDILHAQELSSLCNNCLQQNK